MAMRCQPYPQEGQLAKGLDIEPHALKSRLSSREFEGDTVYCYVVATVRNDNDHFCQTGSAPNFQGDLITLCTCKHHMRTFRRLDEWLGKWIAGFTGVEAGRGTNELVYLMRIGCAFDSHRDLWYSSGLTSATREAKAADKNQLGDVYRPLSATVPRFRPLSYIEPTEGHAHRQANCGACSGGGTWRKDVNYRSRSGRRPALLVGDPKLSFLWDKPMVGLPFRLHRGQKKVGLGYLLDRLEREDL